MNLSRLGLCIVGLGLAGFLASNFQPAKIISSNNASKAANTHTQQSIKPLIFNSQYATEEAFINHIRELQQKFDIPKKLAALQRKDIPQIAAAALKEARFTYAVPRYMNKTTCENLIGQMLLE